MAKTGKWLIAASALAVAIGTSSPAAAQSAAMNYTTAFRYDSGGLLLGTISPPPTVGTSANFLATRNTYDSQGRLSKVESGVLSSWQADTVAPASWGAAFTVKKTVTYSYDSYGNKAKDTVAGSDGAVAAVTQYSYDGYDRPVCTAVRMDSSQWGSQADACTPQTTAAAGPDRISRTYYDNLGRVIQQWEGVGTSVASAVATRSWTSDSKLQYMIDADGNKAQMVYDGYGRLQCWIFPSKTQPTSYNPSTQSTALSSSGAVSGDCVSSGDYERYGYDNNGNRTSLRKRDGTTLTYAYDALNRMSHKGGAIADTDYNYDLVGHQLTATFTTGGQGITNRYNGYDEILSTTSNMGGTALTLSYLYDGDSDRIRIIHPDGASFSSTYDGMDRLNGVYEGAGTAVPLQAFAYRTDGLLNSRSETGGSSVSYGWDAMSRLQSQNDAFAGGSGNVTWTLGYNPASQLTSDARSNSSYAWTGAAAVNRGYTANGLNQYTAAGATNFTYDANGNLTGDGTWVYTYDGENHLIHATGAGKDVTLRYDPLGRLWKVAGSNIGDVTFLYDGDALVSEFSSAGTMTNRYVHGSNAAADDPLVRYTGSAVGSSNRLYFHADHEGSIVAESSGSGANVAINTYDEYGIPGSANDGRFGYTGQAYLYEIGLDYYKARIYSPTLGRFLQTDPIGYDGGNNLYAYVGDDPVDRVDPSGNFQEGIGFNDDEWKKFNLAQQRAAKDMNTKADGLEAKAAKLAAKHKSGGDMLLAQAKNLRAGAAALSDISPTAAKANLITDKDWQKTYPEGNFKDAQAVTAADRKSVDFRNSNLGVFGADGPGSKWIIGHESIHVATGLPDIVGSNGAAAYLHGNDANIHSYYELRGTLQGASNPDNLMGDLYGD